MIQAILIDDEEPSLLYLQNKLASFPRLKVVSAYTNPHHALNDIEEERIECDVVFLDVEMFDVSGIDLAEEILSVNPNIQTVFVTAHAEHAVEAFELESVDYLLKPFTRSRLEKTVERLILLKDQSSDEQTGQTSATSLTIISFHEFQASFNDELLHFKTAKVKELFAFLLTSIEQYVHRDTIIKALWPDQEYQKAKTNLHTCLSHLRKTLNTIGYENSITFSRKKESYLLSLEPINYDVNQFNQLTRSIDQINETTIDIALEAIELYKGPYLDIDDYTWAYQKALHYHQKVMALLDDIILYYEQRDPAEALVYLQLQRQLDPYLDEKNIKLSMQIYRRLGRRSEALQLYREYKELLRRDLGISPSLELAKLYHDILFL